MWLELELDTKGDEVSVSGRGSRGERPPAHLLSLDAGLEALQSFSSKVGRAVRGGKSLDAPVVEIAHALYEAVIQGELRDVLARLGEASKDQPLLIRVFAQDRTLQSIPWEALCKPGTGEGFLGTDPKLLVARGVMSSEPWEPREVRGAVRLLAIAPGSDVRALASLREALRPATDAGEIEWLDPIAGPDISPRALLDRLRRGKSPHALHFLGHGGVDVSGKPVLRMADDEDGEEVWMTAEALGRELSTSFCADLRLVILEACEGAKAGMLGSAAEILAKAGADAVIAHLWPVKADVARTCSTEIYRALTGADQSKGDVGASVAAARRTLLTQSAEAFSPILYLRGADCVIFDFQGRRVARPSAKQQSKNIAPALQSLLEKPYTLILADREEDRAVMVREFRQFMRDNGEELPEGLRLVSIAQICRLLFGQEVLHGLFQRVSGSLLQTPPAPLTRALGRLVPPGVHFTLLWQPYLEHAIAEAQPHRNIYVIYPSQLSSTVKPRVVKRAAGASVWKMELMLPNGFNFASDIVVVRIYGGYSPEAHPILSPPMLTEDDHVEGFLEADNRPPSWMEELLARPRILPGLFVGLSVLEIRHRMLLRWVYDDRRAPKGTLAILTPANSPREPDLWEGGDVLAGHGRITAIVEDPVQLAAQLDGLTIEPSG